MAGCVRCREALAALRDVPKALQASAVVRDENFWRRQRQEIMRAIRITTPAPRRALSPAAVWRGGLVAVATALLAVASYRMLPHGKAPMRPVAQRPSPQHVDDLETDTVAALSEIFSAWAPESELMPGGREIDEELAGDLAGSGWLAPPSASDEIAVNDLDDHELDRLDDLIGARSG